MVGKNRRLLIVDGDPSFLEMVQFVLNPPAFAPENEKVVRARWETPFELTTVTKPEEAISAVEASLRSGLPYSGIFADLHLNGGQGLVPLLEHCEGRDRRLQFVFFSAQVDQKLADIATYFGPARALQWDYLAKPFDELALWHKACRVSALWELSRLSEKEAWSKTSSSSALSLKKAKS